MIRLVIALALIALAIDGPRAARIAIIMDDLGHNSKVGARAIALPGPVTLSVLPYTRHSRSLAEAASREGKEVMLHLPMANMANLPIGPGGLDASLSRQDFLERLASAVARVPHARGINNHMGSYLTQQPLEMNWLMTELSRRQLFFVDSRTTPDTVAATIARQRNILSSSRDVFLDNTKTFYEIDRAFRQLISIARKNGTAIAIAHPHEVTLQYLEIALPLLEREGIAMLPVSRLLALRQSLRLAKSSADGNDLRFHEPDTAR